MELDRSRPATLSHYEALVLDALQRVVRDLDEALDLKALAAPACMAPLHFHRVFRGLVGETPLQLQRRLRLERAAWRLQQHDDTVLRIALDAGYDTHEAFTRAFKDSFGRSPSEHRQLARSSAAPPSHHIQAACGLHADGPLVVLPADMAGLIQRHGAFHMQIEILECAALRVAVLTHLGPYNTIGAAFERLHRIAGPAGLAGAVVALYHDDPESVPAAQLRSSAGLVVAVDARLPPELHELQLPGGPWARTVHRGPYRHLGDTWQRLLGQWLPASGRRLRAADFYERYLNMPGEVSQQDLQTALYVPLEDAAA